MLARFPVLFAYTAAGYGLELKIAIVTKCFLVFV